MDYRTPVGREFNKARRQKHKDNVGRVHGIFCNVCDGIRGICTGKNPCAGDVAKFCGNVKPGEGRQALCLKQHEAQLSPACKMHLVKKEEALKETIQACENDITKYCKGVQPGEGRIAKCLRANKSHLSQKCRTKITEEKKEFME